VQQEKNAARQQTNPIVYTSFYGIGNVVIAIVQEERDNRLSAFFYSTLAEESSAHVHWSFLVCIISFAMVPVCSRCDCPLATHLNSGKPLGTGYCE